ncbi:phage holin family protein [Flaviaesturariibacter terrae]
MEELKSKTGTLTQSVSDYLDTYYKLALVTLTQKATNVTAGLVAGLSAVILTIFILFFLGMGLAWWLGGLLGSTAAGFFIVGGVFIVLMVVIVLLRKKLVFPILKKAILKKIYE